MNKIIFFFLVAGIPFVSVAQHTAKTEAWHIISVQNPPQRREDCAFVAVNNRFYLIGGRGIKPVEVFDPRINSWQVKGLTPVEMNHFQAVESKHIIFVVGAMNGGYPHEKTIENIYTYQPEKDQWKKGPALPSGRLRGSGGTVVYHDKIYLVGGIQDGHYSGTVSWMDEFDPATGNWRILPDAPHARDHFQAAVIGNKLYLVGGRQTSAKTGQGMQLTVPEIDVYDFTAREWKTLPESQNIPTPRAGCTAVKYKHRLLVIGGESMAQKASHREVEAFDTKKETWSKLPGLVTGRHDTQAISWKNTIYIVAGSANSGGGPDQNSIEALQLKSGSF